MESQKLDGSNEKSTILDVDGKFQYPRLPTRSPGHRAQHQLGDRDPGRFDQPTRRQGVDEGKKALGFRD